LRKEQTMATLPGLQAIKEMPIFSGSTVDALGKQLANLVGVASDHAASIHRVVNLQELVSAKRLDQAFDELAGIRQIAVGFDDLHAHFAHDATASAVVEEQRLRAWELLRSASADYATISALMVS
jgi:hypothetical protein